MMPSNRCVFILSLTCALTIAGTFEARGQSTDPAPPPTAAAQPPDPSQQPVVVQVPETSEVEPGGFFRHLAGDFVHLPSKHTFLTLGVGGGLALAVHPWDDTANERFAQSDAFFTPGKWVGASYVQLAAATTTVIVGKAVHKPKVAHLGTDLLRAQLVAQALTQAIKVSVRRTRPDESAGFSFPSGHSSVAFATAAVLTRHLGWKGALPTYAAASYVALSRMHEDRHFLSDVVFGAAVGIVSGRTATRHGRKNYSMMPAAVPGGVGVFITRNGP